MRLIHHAGLTAVPWKNGGGETREIAAFPPGAGFDDFDWRLSIASIAVDGPFSAFPGIDRTLILLSGNGIGLRLDEGEEHLLHPGDLLAFAGEQAVRSRLLDGPVRDLNIMTRRERITAQVETVTLRGTAVLDPGTGGGAVVLRDGEASLPDGTRLGQGDTILCDAGDSDRIALTGEARLILIRLSRA